MSNLKPCPFCGRTPKVENCKDFGYFVKCKCGIEQSTLYAQRCDAVRRWNMRKGVLAGKHADQMIIDEACMNGDGQ